MCELSLRGAGAVFGISTRWVQSMLKSLHKWSDRGRPTFMHRKSDKPKSGSGEEIVVFSVVRASQCTECGADLWKGSLLRLEGEKALCMGCADLDRLEFLPSGDAAVTRRASKYSKLRAVVVRWSRARKRYERQGILVELEALRRAEEESLADAEDRKWRQARAAERREHEDHEFVTAFGDKGSANSTSDVRHPKRREIATHACRKYSGRVGRTAAAKELSPEAIRLAVIAHIRHAHTNYDELLARYADRDTARERIRGEVSAILDDWQRPRRSERIETGQPPKDHREKTWCGRTVAGGRKHDAGAGPLQNRHTTQWHRLWIPDR